MISQFKDQILKWALIVSGFQIGLTLILYILGPEYMAQIWVGIVAFVVSLGLVAYGGVQARNDNEGFLSFKEAFTVTFAILFVAAFIGALFNTVLYTIIDPELGDKIKEIAIERTISMMEGFGSSEADIDAAIERVNEQNYGFTQQMTGLLWAIPINAIFALIISAFIKKKRPEIFD